MTEYQVKIGFWLRAHDSVSIEAVSDAEAIRKAKAAALKAMASRAYPENIDLDTRREGIIVYVDRVVGGRREVVAEDVEFDDDRIHPAPVLASGVSSYNRHKLALEVQDAVNLRALAREFVRIVDQAADESKSTSATRHDAAVILLVNKFESLCGSAGRFRDAYASCKAKANSRQSQDQEEPS